MWRRQAGGTLPLLPPAHPAHGPSQVAGQAGRDGMRRKPPGTGTMTGRDQTVLALVYRDGHAGAIAVGAWMEHHIRTLHGVLRRTRVPR